MNAEVKLRMNAVKSFTGKIILMNTAGKILSENSHYFYIGNSEASIYLIDVSSGAYITAVYNQDNVMVALHTIVKL